jgi:DNA polymerase-3 subunit delta'
VTFGEILGQESALTLLRRCLASGRLPHSLLFSGPEGVGKSTVARLLAATLLCERGGEEPCGACASCKKVESRNHPDLFLIGRLPKKGSDKDAPESAEGEAAGGGDLRAQITVEQVRDVIEHATYGPQEGSRRVFLIDPADRLNASSQNALLKTLEEPAGRSLFVLISARPQILLPTVRSRCLAVRFAPVPPERLAPLLEKKGYAKSEALARAALAQGRPGYALDFDLEALRQRRDGILADLEALAASRASVADLPSMAARLAGGDEEEMIEGLDLLEGLLRDASRSTLGTSALLNTDRADRLAVLGGKLGPRRSAEILGSVERVRGDLRFHLSRALVTESLLAAVAGGPLL